MGNVFNNKLNTKLQCKAALGILSEFVIMTFMGIVSNRVVGKKKSNILAPTQPGILSKAS